MRGKHYGRHPCDRVYRITPADAGKTPLSSCFRPRFEDHPRGCGENFVPSLAHCGKVGSPPRMRGKLQRSSSKRAFSRITPADAGKTSRHTTPRCLARDHPRGCGENNVKQQSEFGVLGSPPRMRGKLVGSVFNDGVYRITPADAGKTTRAVRRAIVKWDHPRGCGENALGGNNSVMSMGSPPRMRGKHSSKNVNMLSMRITPADAGKTIKSCQSRAMEWDHPRGCGENAVTLLRDCRRGGSPPRMRGKQINPYATPSTSRITPADAGKTTRISRHISSARDHPRGCGENPTSSHRKSSTARITPADAGKTRALEHGELDD